MAVLKYKDDNGVWHRLCQNGEVSEDVIRQKTHNVVDDMVEDLVPGTSSINEIISSLKQHAYDDDTSWVDVKVQNIVNDIVEDLYPETTTNGELIVALKTGSTPSGDTWVSKTIKNKINGEVKSLNEETSSIAEVIEALQSI